MNKKLILKFLKEKSFINKFTKNKQHFFNLLEDYKFFSEIINTKTLNYPNNDIENGIKYLEEAQTWIKSVNTHFKTPKEYPLKFIIVHLPLHNLVHNILQHILYLLLYYFYQHHI